MKNFKSFGIFSIVLLLLLTIILLFIWSYATKPLPNHNYGKLGKNTYNILAKYSENKDPNKYKEFHIYLHGFNKLTSDKKFNLISDFYDMYKDSLSEYVIVDIYNDNVIKYYEINPIENLIIFKKSNTTCFKFNKINKEFCK